VEVGLGGLRLGVHRPGRPERRRRATPPTAEILIQNFRFDPPTISVPVGTTVTWTHHDEEIR
jgi:plastocyanin